LEHTPREWTLKRSTQEASALSEAVRQSLLKGSRSYKLETVKYVVYRIYIWLRDRTGGIVTIAIDALFPRGVHSLRSCAPKLAQGISRSCTILFNLETGLYSIPKIPDSESRSTKSLNPDPIRIHFLVVCI
jgi:hypothetical protein